MAEKKSGSEVRDEKDQKVDEVGEIMKLLYADQDDKKQENTNPFGDAGPVPPPFKYSNFEDRWSYFNNIEDGGSGQYKNENVEDREFGRYTNRNDYFHITPLNVHTDKHLSATACNGGGGGGRSRQLSPGVDSNNGGEVFDKWLINSETESSNTERFYNYDHAPSLKVFILEQKMRVMEKKQHEREEELHAKLEIERKLVADLQKQHAELVAKMDEQARLSEQFSAFMRAYH